MIFCTSTRKYFASCLLTIVESNNVLIVSDIIISTRFVDINDDVQSASNRIMIQRAKYQSTKENVLIVKAIIRFNRFNARSE
jgi:hypothetical protein